jgi:crotonobetainyl-CoA:carnitine CoA-transferase CaiB-like acyl-CoA transferase
MYRLPLSGIRVLDLTVGWAGPYAGRLLGDMGAEVIKIEPARHWDVTRAPHLPGPDVERGYDRSSYFNRLNRNKLGCSLDLSQPRGKELFLKLVALSDAVIDDQGAMEDLGLSYEALRQARPDVTLVSMSVQGKDGPEAGVFAGAALCTALLYRRRTGRGRWVEVAQRESMTGLVGELFVGFSMNGRQPPLLGNRHPSMAPHGCYPCAGLSEAGWLAIAVASDSEFAALCRVMGRAELAADPRFADVVSRYRHQDELDEAISAWTRGKTPQEAALALQEAGVAAAPVASVADLMEDPHLRARGFFEKTAHPEAGVWEMDGVPWRLSLTPAHVRLSTPCFGEHNDYVFRHLLGLSAEELAALERQGVTGREPEEAVEG